MTITTTLNRIRAHYPCQSGWTTLLKGLNKRPSCNDVLEDGLGNGDAIRLVDRLAGIGEKIRHTRGRC